MNANAIRLILAAGIVWYALGGSLPSVGPVATYTGPLTALHTAARSMDPKDREGLSEALQALGKMVSDDRMGAIKTTADVQTFIETGLNFGYSTFQTKQYPTVAQYLQDEISKVVGGIEGPADAAVKSRVSAALDDASRAVR
jgi:hypothetical protein